MSGRRESLGNFFAPPKLGAASPRRAHLHSVPSAALEERNLGQPTQRLMAWLARYKMRPTKELIWQARAERHLWPVVKPVAMRFAPREHLGYSRPTPIPPTEPICRAHSGPSALKQAPRWSGLVPHAAQTELTLIPNCFGPPRRGNSGGRHRLGGS